SPDRKPDAVLSRFGWVNDPRPPTREQCRDFEPLARESLALLSALAPEVGVYLNISEFRDGTHFEQVFKELNEALERIRARAGVLADGIRESQLCFSEELVRNWSPASTPNPAHDWTNLLERWSGRIAMADLVDKHWQITKTLAETGRHGHG